MIEQQIGQTIYDDMGRPIKNQIQDPCLRRQVENYWKIVQGIPTNDEEQYMPFISYSIACMDLEREKNQLSVSRNVLLIPLAIFIIIFLMYVFIIPS